MARVREYFTPVNPWPGFITWAVMIILTKSLMPTSRMAHEVALARVAAECAV